MRAWEVRAILDGRRTQARQLVRPQPMNDMSVFGRGVPIGEDRFGVHIHVAHGDSRCVYFPYGAPGDRLWVREPWRLVGEWADWTPKEIGDHFHYPDEAMRDFLRYRADDKPYDGGDADPWRSPLHMPRWASRMTLEIVSMRVERLQEITDADAIAEGIAPTGSVLYADEPLSDQLEHLRFRDLWDSIHGKRAPFSSNPWVWVPEFRRVE